MSDKASPAGWVVQVITFASAVAKPDSSWIGLTALGAPSFKYFNVAIAAPNKAIAATNALWGEAGDRRAVRPLSAKEIAALRLKPGETKPA